MDTQSSNKGKGVFYGEQLNQPPAPTTPYNQYYIHPHATVLDVLPLTEAKPGEPVAHTPSCIIGHPAYEGGWKVLQYRRPDGRVDYTYNHKDFGRLRSKKAVLNLLDDLLKMKENEKKSAHQDEQSSGVERTDAKGITLDSHQDKGVCPTCSASPIEA